MTPRPADGAQSIRFVSGHETAQFHMHDSARNGLTGNLQNKAAPATVLEDEVFEPLGVTGKPGR